MQRRSAARAASPLQRLVVLVALGVFVLASLAALTRLLSPTYRATALLSTAPLFATGQSGTPSNDQADRYIQSQLLELNSTALADGVEARAGVADPVLSAVQVGQTDVLAVSAEAPEPEVAERLADAAVALYLERRRTVLTTRLTTLQTRLAALDQSIAQLEDEDESERRRGLEEEYQRLLGEANDLQVDLNGADPLVESAATAGAERALPTTLVAGFLLALGLVLGLLVLVARRWSSGLVMTEDHVVELGGQLAGPALPCVAPGWVADLPSRSGDDDLERTARLAAGSVSTLRDGAPLVVVGPSPASGASFTAVNVAAVLARSRDTALVAAGDALDDAVSGWFGLDPRATGLSDLADRAELDEAAVSRLLLPTPVKGLSVLPAGKAHARRPERVERALAGPAVASLLAAGYAVVVDAPPLDRSRALFGLAPVTPTVVLVAAAGVTTDRQLTESLEALRARTSGPVPVVLVDVPEDAGRT